MEKSEPTLVPQWLRGTGGVTGGGNSLHHIPSSSLRTDTTSTTNRSRSRSKSAADGDSPRSFLLERSFSSTSRHNSHSNGFNKHPYSNFTRTHRDKDRDKDKPFHVDHWGPESIEPLPSIGGRMERDMLRRSRSMISGKHADSFPRRETRTCVNSSHTNGNGVLCRENVPSSIQKIAFEKEFPSLISDERQTVLDIGRVSSPSFNAPIPSFPVGNSALVCSEGWTSALAEVPTATGNNNVLQASHTTATASTVTALNMAETLVQAPSRARQVQNTQVLFQTQRLEELAIRQSRQLIPVTPSMSKSSVLNSTDKLKPKTIGRTGETSASIKGGQQYSSQLSSPVRAGLSKPDSSKTSHIGKFMVLKPARESEGSIRDSTISASKVSNGQLISALPSSSIPAASSNSKRLSIEHKEAVSTSNPERRSSQMQSRNEFFKLMRKKSTTGNSIPSTDPADKDVKEDSGTHTISNEESFMIIKDNINAASDGMESKLDSNATDIEEEEARFLRSLGWEENAEDNDGLTEEEISSFFKEYTKIKPTLRGAHPRLSVLSEFHMDDSEAGA